MPSGQAQKEFFVNEAHMLIDALLHPTVQDVTSTVPASPNIGDVWIVGASATGDWAGMDDALAIYGETGWLFSTPQAGLTVFNQALAQSQQYRDGWHTASEPTAPSGGSTIDLEARASIDELIEILRSAGIIPEN